MTVATCRRAARSSKQRSSVTARQRRGHLRVGLDEGTEGGPFVGRAQREALHDPIGLRARQASLDERAQDPRRGVQPVAGGDVLGHALGPHDETLDQAAEALQHVVQQRRGAGQRDALHGRVADVALVPEGLVLHARQGIAAQQPGHAGEALGEDGVALVGHRRRACLPAPEGLLELADLGVLEVADLHREALDGAAGHGDGGQEGGVPVALHDLRAGRVDGEAQGRQRGRLDLRRQLRVGAHGPGDLARGQVGRGRPQARARPVQLEGPGGQLEAEGDGLGVDAVGAAHHQRAGVLPGARHHGGDGSVQAGQDEVGGGPALQGQRGVHDVAAGQAEVEVAALLADRSRRPA